MVAHFKKCRVSSILRSTVLPSLPCPTINREGARLSVQNYIPLSRRLEGLFRRTNPENFHLCLFHQPRTFHRGRTHQSSLQLSGRGDTSTRVSNNGSPLETVRTL